MTCITPPALTDLDLAMYLEGDADATVAHHIATCPACRDKATAFAQQQAALQAQLYRSTCPTPDELRDYQMNLLNRADAGNVALHLARCPHCTRELFVLKEYLGDIPATVPHFVDQLKLLVARLLSAPAPSTSALLPTGQRGGESNLLLYQAGEFQIGLEVMDDRTSGHKQLHGVITGGDGENLLVHLWRNNVLIATAVVDPLLGDFHFTQLPLSAATGEEPALYELIVSAQETKVRVPALHLGD
ncbi:MAG: hypothetical protein KDE19_14830 [Caldilineaceae bacterium]|nr:hypothetical protein [Caldilineaceae bacterium]